MTRPGIVLWDRNRNPQIHLAPDTRLLCHFREFRLIFSHSCGLFSPIYTQPHRLRVAYITFLFPFRIGSLFCLPFGAHGSGTSLPPPEFRSSPKISKRFQMELLRPKPQYFLNTFVVLSELRFPISMILTSCSSLQVSIPTFPAAFSGPLLPLNVAIDVTLYIIINIELSS